MGITWLKIGLVAIVLLASFQYFPEETRMNIDSGGTLTEYSEGFTNFIKSVGKSDSDSTPSSNQTLENNPDNLDDLEKIGRPTSEVDCGTDSDCLSLSQCESGDCICQDDGYCYH